MDESRLFAHCLQGDVTAAYEYLVSIKDKSKKHLKWETMYYNRFFCGNPKYVINSKDPWIRKVLLAYYQYFSQVLTRKSVKDTESQLITSLSRLLPNTSKIDNLDIIEEKLKGIFREKGYNFLGGLTPPYRGPFIWKTTIKKEYIVELPNHTQKVNVFFLSDFLLQSWIHFSTFGEKFAGGWAKEDGIYFVADRPASKKIKLDSSEFQVSYLKHEAQHQFDFARYPKLPPKDLEYRAKLVELIYEPDSFRLIKKFFYEQKNDSRLPHPYSSFVILSRLSQFAFGHQENKFLERWKTIKPDKIHEWALKLFNDHTEILNENGVQATGVI